MRKNKRIFSLILVISILVMSFSLCFTGCNNDDTETENNNKKTVGWDGEAITYKASDIENFGSATPAGMANYVKENETVAIWNTDASLDNYGGVQTPVMTLDFSKAVIFRMNVVSCHTQYIVKLAVEGESEYYYVLSDDGKTGMVSINVVDAMLCDKYRAKNTQPDPGYRDGWKFKDMKKDCSFHILAKGPDGAQQTAELVLKDISIFNNQTAVDSVEITSDSIQDGKLTALKNSENVKLNATVNPTDVSDKDILWSSQNSDIAKVDENGNVSFVGVGKTYITAMSKIDQSKSKSISVNVLSGYEDVGKLKGRLNNLSYDGSDKDAEIFADLFNTSWYKDADMMQELSIGQYEALNCRIVGNKAYIHNYFNNENQVFVNEANNNANGDKAYIEMALKGAENATIYCNINGKLYKTDYDGLFKLQYLTKQNGKWEKVRTYTEQIIIENTDGTIKKAEFIVNSAVKIAEYTAKDFVNNNLWTVPDRSKQTENPAIHSLSPAEVELDGDMVKIKQNKYPESKYCYGGIASNVLTAPSDQTLEIVLDVDFLNQMNDYVKTMWEIRIIYYQDDKVTPVNSTLLKTMSGNTAGCQTFKFKPAYDNFAFYLMVNGSDIGAQFSGAEMNFALHRPSISNFGKLEIWTAESDNLVNWGNHKVLNLKLGCKNCERLGAGAVPLKTNKGFLEIYHSADKNDKYVLNAMLLDKNNPNKILMKSKQPLIESTEKYEKNGFVNNVVFTCGLVEENGFLFIYYGVCDQNVAMAKISIKDVFANMEEL